jgi:hypothetical protein
VGFAAQEGGGQAAEPGRRSFAGTSDASSSGRCAAVCGLGWQLAQLQQQLWGIGGDEDGKDLGASRARGGLDGAQAATKQTLENLENLVVPVATAGEGGSSSGAAAAAAVPMEVAVPQTPRGVKQLVMAESPSAEAQSRPRSESGPRKFVLRVLAWTRQRIWRQLTSTWTPRPWRM